MSERVYHSNRTDVFRQCDLNPNDKTKTCHHVYPRADQHNQLLPSNFHIDNRVNLLPLDQEIHKNLHFMLDNIPSLNRIDLRVYMANMAFNDELLDIPERLYYSDPKDIMRKH